MIILLQRGLFEMAKETLFTDSEKFWIRTAVSVIAICVTIGLNLYGKFDSLEEKIAAIQAQISKLEASVDFSKCAQK